MNATPLSSILLVLFGSVVGSFGAVFLKSGAVRLTGVLSLLNWRLVLGVALYLASSVFYALGIRHGQLSVLFPMVAAGYVWTLVWSRLFFREQFSTTKMLGLGLVLAGVVLVGLGS
jgi:undecaprenyl phosphate-alpha-L-ara4N flippase subunit ArnE